MYFKLITPAETQKVLLCFSGITVAHLPVCIFQNGLIQLKYNIVFGKCKIYIEQ